MRQDKTLKHEALYRGKDFLERISKRRVIVCGAGALGSHIADSLARIGFTDIKAIDFDRVEEHNVGTQLYGLKDLGALKVEALKNLVYRSTNIEISTSNKRLDKGNVKMLKDSDLVVDAFDNSESRQLVQDESRQRKLNCLHCGLSVDGYGEVVWDECYKVPKNVLGDVCDYPLARSQVIFTAAIAVEEILNFFLKDKPRRESWSITIEDLRIGKYS